MLKNPLLALLLLGLASCLSTGSLEELPEGVEARSLTGADLVPPTLAPEVLARLESNLQEAQRLHALRPQDEMAAIWHGRRLGYLGRYRDSMAIYSEALEQFPASAKLLRHRGHRSITLRNFEDAVTDLREASALMRNEPDRYEPDGAPNAHGIPRSTTHSNIEYHLGLALYLQGKFESALPVWERCVYFSQVNDDMFVAATYWNVLTLWRLGRETDAAALLEPMHAEMEILENEQYHQLLLFYKGVLLEGDIISALWGEGLSSASLGFGLGAWNIAQGREREAYRLFLEIVETTPWNAFGHIAAEAELAR